MLLDDGQKKKLLEQVKEKVVEQLQLQVWWRNPHPLNLDYGGGGGVENCKLQFSNGGGGGRLNLRFFWRPPAHVQTH